MDKKILAAIPMYNCEKQIARVINKFDCTVRNYITDLLIIDNRSADDSLTMCKSIAKERADLNITIIKNNQNYNLGGSHKVAFDYAIKNHYDYVLILHGDDQGDVRDIIPYLSNSEYKKYDCFLGSRFMKGSKLVNYSFIRKYGNRLFNLIFLIISGKKVYDLGAGLNLYNTKFLRNGFYLKYPNSLTFNYYILLYTLNSRASYKYFPLIWKEEDQVSNVKLFSQSKELLKILFWYIFSAKQLLNRKYVTQTDYSYEVIESTNK